jgi:1-deoxy-D-xylulose-5-phosphate synthase
MFEEMGFQYVGLIDGHDVGELCTLFSAYKQDQSAPLFVHLVTTKGKGFEPAEENPGEFHGVSAFDVNRCADPDSALDSSFSSVFGHELARLGGEDTRVCAVTAAMKYGTGLQYFYKQHKDRFFDVGMAEQHAVTFAAGLARSGLLPVVAVYSTFLQRAYDQLIHDVQLQNATVLFAIDRAGLVPGDGATHQGIFDVAYLSQLQGMYVVSPCNYAELTHWLDKLLLHTTGARALRYPRGAQDEALAALPCTGAEYDCFAASDGTARVAMVTYGSETAAVLRAAKALADTDEPVDVYKLCVVHPLPKGLCEALLHYDAILFAEEGVREGGVGEHLAAALLAEGYHGAYRHVALPAKGITHGAVEELRKRFGLDDASLAAVMRQMRDAGK